MHIFSMCVYVDINGCMCEYGRCIHIYSLNLNRCNANLFHLLCISRLLYQRLEVCYNVYTNCCLAVAGLCKVILKHTHTICISMCICTYVCMFVYVCVCVCVCIYIVYAITPCCCCWQLELHCFRRRHAEIFSTTAAYLACKHTYIYALTYLCLFPTASLPLLLLSSSTNPTAATATSARYCHSL